MSQKILASYSELNYKQIPSKYMYMYGHVAMDTGFHGHTHVLYNVQ